jgi:uncharacterized protein (TIGR03067 family)
MSLAMWLPVLGYLMMQVVVPMPSGPAVTMQGNPQPFGGLAFSPDGQRLAGGASDGAVWVWGTSTADDTLVAASSPASGQPVRIWSLVSEPSRGDARALAQDGASDDARRLQGTWFIDPAIYKDVRDKEALQSIKAVRVIFARDSVTFKHPPGNEEKVFFHLDPSKKPKQIDFSEGVKGIYEPNGDTLKMCWDKRAKTRGRPKQFPTDKKTDLDFLVLKREKQ